MFKTKKKIKELELEIGGLSARCRCYEALISELRGEIENLRPKKIKNTLNIVRGSAKGLREISLVDDVLVFDME